MDIYICIYTFIYMAGACVRQASRAPSGCNSYARQGAYRDQTDGVRAAYIYTHIGLHVLHAYQYIYISAYIYGQARNRGCSVHARQSACRDKIVVAVHIYAHIFMYMFYMHINISIYTYTYGQRVRAPGVGLQLPREAGRL